LQSREEQLRLQARYVSRLEYEILQAREEKLGRDTALIDLTREITWLRERLASLAGEMDRVARIEASKMWRLIAALRSLARAAKRLWRADATTAMLLFDEDYYRRSYPEVGANPLTDYLSLGWKAGRNPHPLFNTNFYLQSNLDVAASGVNPLVHYLTLGGFEGRNPHPLFLSKWYLDANPDVAASGMNPLHHFLHYGGRDGRDPHPWFDSSYYLQRYPDVATAHVNPLVHFVTIGAAELRDPNDQFVTAFYVESNPDAATPSTNPLVHYLEIGRAEGRACQPPDAMQRSEDIGPLAKDRLESDAAYLRLKRLGRDAESIRLRSVDAKPNDSDQFNDARLIAFYLPQFHPIAENDLWWGAGFTEWRNVTRARPNFVGHDQPRQPADLGYYDLRLNEVYRKQVELAADHGLSGFCFYYYRFGNRKLLDGPIERLLRPDAPSFPFCLAWANENWTRRWDGREQDVLIRQVYSEDDDRAALSDLSRFFEHPAYLRINGRPLVLIYRIGLFPDIRRTVEIWRDEGRRRGIGEIYVAAIASFEVSLSSDLPVQAGFDAMVEFPPHNRRTRPKPCGQIVNSSFRGFVFDYEETALSYMAERPTNMTTFRGVMPGWDNTARKQDEPNIFVGSTPGAYRAWLEEAIRQTTRQNSGDERLVFINAWNEWAEGAYLEPDLRWGRAYLEATRQAVNTLESKD
jgi:glycosyl transferase family WbsX